MSYKELHLNTDQIESLKLRGSTFAYTFYIQKEPEFGWFGRLKKERGLYEYHYYTHPVKVLDEIDEDSINEFLKDYNKNKKLSSQVYYEDGDFYDYPYVLLTFISGRTERFTFKNLDECRMFIDELTSLNTKIRKIESS